MVQLEDTSLMTVTGFVGSVGGGSSVPLWGGICYCGKTDVVILECSQVSSNSENSNVAIE